MKRWPLYTLLVVCVLAAGGWYADRVVKERVGAQVIATLNDPSVQNELHQLTNDPALANKLDGTGVDVNVVGSLSGLQSSQNSAASGGTAAGSSGGKARGQDGTGGSLPPVGSAGEAGTRTGSNGFSGAGSTAPGASGSGGGNAGGSTGTSSPGASVPTFTSRQQLIDYAMSHFTASEIAHYMTEYLHRSSLTEAQKTAIKEQILSHFTPAEIIDMEQAYQRLH
ncbi:MAG: hypothetical protein K6T78_11580 [Alicyclobacillus sp.]|nr:hypothetical protein [Alicyclobacillus sp.]